MYVKRPRHRIQSGLDETDLHLDLLSSHKHSNQNLQSYSPALRQTFHQPFAYNPLIPITFSLSLISRAFLPPCLHNLNKAIHIIITPFCYQLLTSLYFHYTQLANSQCLLSLVPHPLHCCTQTSDWS